MNSDTGRHLEALRSALLQLDPAGPHGFEGLLAVVLTELCGQPFRLASSGSQRGRDGDSAFDAGAIYFEGKRYDGPVPKEQVAVKLMDLRADDAGQVDTWILGATSEIGAVHATDFRKSFESAGIGFVLLDWSNTALPPLALAICSAATRAKEFLREHLAHPRRARAAIEAIDHLATLDEVSQLSARLRDTLNDSSTGLGAAKQVNRRWLEGTFANRILARQLFGQPLAPRDPTAPQAEPRTALSAELSPALCGAPDAAVYAVIGDEGVGKSWLVADTWLSLAAAPLLLVCTADSLKNPQDLHDVEGFLVRQLTSQTGGQLTVASDTRWRRRLAGWLANPNPNDVRVALWIDGLNQFPDFPWSRWIDAASLMMAKIGGRLIITTRSIHFGRIRHALASQTRRVIVRDWSDLELAALLRARQVDPGVLSADVFTTLRNPRVLAIAIDLLTAKSIERIDELSVGRLLFEHMRRAETSGATPVSAQEFAKTLRELASGIVERLSENRRDDLRVFDAQIDERLKAVALSRFFEEVSGDPDLYEIKEEGLRLALGLWLVDALRREHRNGRDPRARLEITLEPVSALDLTAEIVSSAAQIACLIEDCPVPVTAALLRLYVGLQNVPETEEPVFKSLVKHAPDAFVMAAENAALAVEHLPNMDWITRALLEARGDAAVWKAISEAVPRWLRQHSLAPERRMLTNSARDPKEKVDAERQKRQADIDTSLQGLTASERSFLDRHLVPCEGLDLDGLHRLAFYLLSGQSLTRFAPALAAWYFFDSLNGGIHAPDRDLANLIRFNVVDWQETRSALLASVREFQGSGQSKVGEWATIGALRGTGGVEDAEQAQRRAEWLTRDREPVASWRLVEDYCSSDPCDPSSSFPDNIEQTAMRSLEVDVTKLGLHVGQTAEDHFLSTALPGLARFKPEVAIAIHQELAANVLTRAGLSRRQGVLMLLQHSAILDESSVPLFAAAALETETLLEDDSTSRDQWVTAQYSLFIALPHMNPSEQLTAIVGQKGGPLLLSLLEAVRPAEPEVVEKALNIALLRADEEAQSRILGSIHHTAAILSERSTRIVAELITSPVKIVRMQALAVASVSGDRYLLQQLVNSGWSAHALDVRDDRYERWYGSLALIRAAEAGLVEASRALDRMSLDHYGFAAHVLGGTVAAAVADRIDAELKRALRYVETPDVPDIERPTQSDATTIPLASLSDAGEPKTRKGFIEQMNETNEEFDARQKRAGAAYDRFVADLTAADAGLVIADIGSAGIRAALDATPELLERWSVLMLHAARPQKRLLHLFAVQFADAVAPTAPRVAAALFEGYRSTVPLIRHVVGISKIPVEALAIWKHAKIQELRPLCRLRLNRAKNDGELATEVLAALQTGHSAVLEEYVDELLTSAVPTRIARALMICGFSDRSERARAVLTQFEGSSGFIGVAQRAAREAYERNLWSREWYRRMASAHELTEFWRCATLLAKIVDDRIAVWSNLVSEPTATLERFYPTVESEIKRRIKKWQDKRRKQLFGERVPETIFLRG